MLFKRLLPAVLILSLMACAPAQQPGPDLLEAPQAQALLQQKQALVLLDVRTPAEFQQGHIKKAENLDFYQNFGDQLAKLDKKREYLVYCAVGGRSAKAVNQMRDQGFKVYDLNGGLKAWMAAGLPVSK